MISSFHHLNDIFTSGSVPMLMIAGITLLLSFYVGKSTKILKLPSIIGYMIVGLLAGPSLLDLLNENVQHNLSFLTEIALGFVALSIGLELSMPSLKKQGIGIVAIILFESSAAFIVTTLGLYILTKDLALSLIFGSFAPASAPAGTVAIIKEYKAKGSLTKALYAVVGFDDGLAIIIFGFTAAFVRMLLLRETNSAETDSVIYAMMEPLKEVFLSLIAGGGIAVILSILTTKTKSKSELLIIVVGFILLSNGLCIVLHLSLILTNMVIGFIIVNTKSHELTHRLSDVLSEVMPLFFVLFFALAGANLHISALPALGAIGVVYIICRSVGLITGSFIGGSIGKVEPKIRNYVGMGILSQAGVAIGLSLIVKHEFQGMGKIVKIVDGLEVHSGDIIGTIGITTVTATCIFFEILGPILTKIALTKAGEIKTEQSILKI